MKFCDTMLGEYANFQKNVKNSKILVDICEILQMVESQDGHQSPFKILVITITFDRIERLKPSWTCLAWHAIAKKLRINTIVRKIQHGYRTPS